MSGISRRKFLGTGLIAAEAPFIVTSCQREPLPELFLRELSSQLGIGKTYLGTLAKGQIAKFSLKRDFGILSQAFKGVEPRDYASHYLALVKSDFRQSRTVVVSGWLLSITEARVLALFDVGLPK